MEPNKNIDAEFLKGTVAGYLYFDCELDIRYIDMQLYNRLFNPTRWQRFCDRLHKRSFLKHPKNRKNGKVIICSTPNFPNNAFKRWKE